MKQRYGLGMAQVETARDPVDVARLGTTLIPLFAPAWHYCHLFDDVLPALRERGVTDDQIETMLVVNPRRYFSGVSGA
jgi:predicted metal-dependent phosphotriesterase family hydrolase